MEPTAPIPVQMGYARLRGRVLIANPKKIVDANIPTSVIIEYDNTLKPSLSFMVVDQTTSMIPATNK